MRGSLLGNCPQSWFKVFGQRCLLMVKNHLRMVVSWPGNISPSSTMSSTTSLTWFRRSKTLLSILYFLWSSQQFQKITIPEIPFSCENVSLIALPCTSHWCLFGLSVCLFVCVCVFFVQFTSSPMYIPLIIFSNVCCPGLRDIASTLKSNLKQRLLQKKRFSPLRPIWFWHNPVPHCRQKRPIQCWPPCAVV